MRKISQAVVFSLVGALATNVLGIAPASAAILNPSTVIPVASAGSCRTVGSIKFVKSVRYKCESSNGRKSWVKFVPRIVSVTEPPYVAVYREIEERGRVASSKSYNTQLEWIVSPTIPAAKVNEAKRRIIDALGPWFELGVETEGLRVFILDEFGAGVYEARRLDRENCTLSPASELPFGPTAGIGWGACGQRDGTLIMMLGSQLAGWGNGMVHHEVTHLGQRALIRKGWGTRASSPESVVSPCWIDEAEANLFSDIFASSWANSHETSVSYFRRRVARDGLTDGEKWLDFLTKRENWGSLECWEDQYRYSTLLIYERVYLDFGSSRVTKWRLASATQDWRIAFQNEFGISVRDWYLRSVIPYIRSEIG